MTILPQALSPHSLASVPSLGFDAGTSFTFSVPRNLSGGVLGASAGGGAAAEYEDEDEGLGRDNGEHSCSEASETETDTDREASQHGPSGRLPALGGGGGAGRPA